MFHSFRQTNARFILNLSSRTLECHVWLIIYCVTHARQGHFNYYPASNHAPAYIMAADAGIIKAIVSFYRVNSDTAFERHRRRIPSNDLGPVYMEGGCPG